LININDIRGVSAINFLKEYDGKNPYIKKLKNKLLKDGKISLTDTQSKYVIENHAKEPILINKIVRVSEYLGEELKKQENLSFVPEKILIEYILADSDKTYHVYGKLKRNQEKSDMYFLPKTQILDDPYYEEINIDVDFEKYEKLDTFKLKDGKIGRTLYEHQKEGIKFLLAKNGCILADDMGLGKSIQATIAALESGAKKILLVCPSAVKINWEREIQYFQCFDTTIIDSKEWKDAKFTIINYDILKNFHTVKDDSNSQYYSSMENQNLLNSKFDLCIIDEAHYLKNKDSKRGVIMVDICQNIPKVWLLTGTPVANRPMDYFNLLKLIKSPLTDNWKFYATRYCEGKQIRTKLKNGMLKKVWLTNGASNLEELSIKTKNTFLRRMKTEIGDMPDKIITSVYHKFNSKQLKQYEELWEEYLIEREKNKKKGDPQRDLVELGLLRKFVAMEAIPQTIEMAENIIDQENKLIIFTNFTDELLELANHFKDKAVLHYGDMSDKEKQKSVDRFQNDDKVRVFIGNIKSAGVGITLTAANYTIFNSFDWVPGNNEQSEDRNYRIGQKNNVNIYYQLYENTISTKMWCVLQKKKEIIDTILNGNNLSDDEITNIMINEILKDE
jgi:SWI/SNF-related matrix-associated actin-dependent regulator 1 of chromatin subfamily A